MRPLQSRYTVACRKIGDSVRNQVGLNIGEFLIWSLCMAGHYVRGHNLSICSFNLAIWYSIAKSPNLVYRQYFCVYGIPIYTDFRLTALDVALLNSHRDCADYLISCHAPTRGGAHHRAACTIQAVWRYYRHKVRQDSSSIFT